MPVLLNADASFSSMQELLDLQDSCPALGGLGGPMGAVEDNLSPVQDSQPASPAGSLHGPPGGRRRSHPGSPASTPNNNNNKGSKTPQQAMVFTRASTVVGVPGLLYPDVGSSPGSPMGLNLISSSAANNASSSEGGLGERLLCGWGGLTPRAVQTFNTPRWVLFFLCVASFLQGMIVNGFINTVVTSIERRFDLRSYQAGLIASSYDIAACVCLAFVSYVGGTGDKPRWLGWGVLVMALGSLVFALPHFTTPPYQVVTSEHTGMCSSNRTGPCQDKEGSMSSYRFVFMLGQFLHSFGATPLYTLGVTYLDENVKANQAPVYIGQVVSLNNVVSNIEPEIVSSKPPLIIG